MRTLRKQRSHSTFMRHQILSAYFLQILLSDFLQKGKVLTVGSENQFASNFKSNKHYERMLLKKWQNSRWMPGINLEISYDIEFKSHCEGNNFTRESK